MCTVPTSILSTSLFLPLPSPLPLCQTGEMGLTQSVGEEGVRFEVWVRQAPRIRDCLTLQCQSGEGRAAWTHDIAQLLWTHAIHNTGTV